MVIFTLTKLNLPKMRKFLLACSMLTGLSVSAQQFTPVAIQGRLVATKKPSIITGETDAFVPRITRDENGLVGVPKKTAIIRPFHQDIAARIDPVLQQGAQANRPLTPNGVTAASATIGTNVNGMGYTSVNPSDPVVAAGPNHVIQMINSGAGSLMKIFNKDGSQVAAQFNFSNITGVQGAGDPVILYDQLSKRWVLTEFGYTGGITSFVNTLILAVSATDDPLGSWYVYAFADYTFFVDFPKFSIWTDGYYATSNDFNTAGTAYLGSSVYAFDRTKMLAGNVTATAIRVRLNNADGRYFSMAPVSIEGITPPPAARKSMFLYYTNDATTADPADVDSIYMINMIPDFVTPANTVISAPTRFVPAAFDDELCTAVRGRCIDQQTNTTTDLEDLAGRMSNKIVYRNFGTHEGIVCNFTVDADGAGKGGIRWTELRNTGSWSIFQEGTWAPDGNERWLGSACYDGVGNIGLVYNVSGTTANPSVRFTARNPCDALGTMTLPETVIVAGTASNGSTRYGDYNVLTVDPATDRDFWLTAQHNGGATTWNTRIATFNLNNCNGLPKVRFYTNAVTAYEDSLKTVGTGCQRYRDYTVNVVIDAAPSQPAIVTFTTSGTATSGSDYTITPASVTLNSVTLSQPVTIRVFADNNVEGAETINVSYSINPSGGNATADSYNQSLSLDIRDNDVTITPLASTAVLLTEGFGTSATPGPTSGTWTVINPNTVANTWVYSANGGTGITSGAAHITNSTTTKPLTYTITTSDTATLRSPLINATTFSGNSDSLKLFIRYKSNGESNFDFGRLRYSLDGSNFFNIPGTSNLQLVSTLTDLTVNLPALLKGQQFYIGYYWQNDNSVGTDPPFTLDSTAVTASGVKVETTAGSSNSGYITTTQPASFLSSADGEVIASVSNMTNIGCLTSTVFAAGTGRQSATINGASAFRSDKVIQLTPDVVYAGTYRATIYFTTAEMAVWGGTAAALNILKVPDTDPLGATITGSVVSPVSIDDQLATRGYIAYTADFTGFSKFMLTNRATLLPVQDLQFAARPLTQSILLNWSTRAEFNSRHFVIERSTDGLQFGNIATVGARGNTNQLSQYSFVDENVIKGITYYYRLRQVDMDAKELFSEIRKARLGDGRGSMVLQPNPAHHSVRIIIDGKHSQAIISVTDAAGKTVVKQNRDNNQNGIYDVNIESLAAGTYTVKITAGEQVYTEKLVKQ
jgi:Secretion system C-terminal sorting domain